MLKALDRVEAMDISMICTGHGMGSRRRSGSTGYEAIQRMVDSGQSE